MNPKKEANKKQAKYLCHRLTQYALKHVYIFYMFNKSCKPTFEVSITILIN